MEMNLYIAIIDRQYRGESNIYVTSPICKDKDFAQKLLFKEFEKLKAEILPPAYYVDGIDENDSSFYFTDENINDVWGWVQEVKVDVDDDFDDLKSAYTILSMKEVDNVDDNFLNVDIVLSEQPYKDKVYEKIDELIENFKKNFQPMYMTRAMKKNCLLIVANQYHSRMTMMMRVN